MTTKHAGPDGADTADGADGSHGPGRAQPVDDAVSRFVERFAAQLTEAGMQRMPSRIFAAVLASDSGALTTAELGEQLKVSPAAISGAVRYLAQVNMITREREPGSRRDRFRVHSDQWYESLTNRDLVLRRWENTLREGVENLGPDSPAGRRMGETLAFFEFLEGELGTMMQRWRAYREERFG
ncbi:MarR family transcriptional regulator [Streptomyces sp. NBC_01267]|uniref:GbsR/MarR family transcriptional regulator n=1 Tax=unclassified Streptomyces TaxID=2593676 RepID=UPI00202438CC|nr:MULTISPECIES: MarR family transcriptional regulator [unclassified Streptomyces]MCX4549866.1 MarR family transcriptional regulator [Streptomyces sp. NBC_01500]WSC21381.1 MarR family transcriptional regulator [Streptomyces sp. NBC_01766]WSV55319.1 MarR family transcriptional regulator [Streptomyces sp. NBC_01014]